MTTLKHKGFQGAVSFEDGRLLIEILHIGDLITAECDSASAARGVFEDLVDDYLATCAEIGREPGRPFKGSFNVRVGPDLHRRSAQAAAALDTTLNGFVEVALKEKLGRGSDA